MKNTMKQVLGAVALSATVLSMIGIDGAVAKGKSATIPNDPPPAAEYGSQGQHFDKGKGQIPPAANDPCKRPGTQCDPRDGGASTKRNKSDTAKPNPPAVAPN